MQIYVYFHNMETFSFFYKKIPTLRLETSGYLLAKGAIKKRPFTLSSGYPVN